MHGIADRRFTRLLVAGATALLFAQPAIASAQTPPPAKPNVGPSIEVGVRELAQTIQAEGVVETVRQATLGAQVAGRIVELAVKAGDTVEQKQTLLSVL